MQNAARIENCVQTLAQTVPRRLRLPILNKLLGALWLASLPWERMQLLVPVALIQQDLGICLDGVRAPQPLGLSGPMAQDLLTRTGTQDADLILSRTQRMKMSEAPYYFSFPIWLEKVWATTNVPSFNRPIRNHCEIGSQSARLVFETRGNCQDFVARYKDDGIPYEIDSPFCSVKTTITVRQPDQLRTGRSENNLRPCGKFWLNSSKFSSLKEMTQVLSSSQRSTPAHKFSALRIEETVLENLCSNLHLLEVDSCLPLLHLTCVFLVFSSEVLQRVISQASTATV